MRALLLYSLAGLVWAIVSHHNVLAFHDPIFWRDAVGWPVLLFLALIDLRIAMPRRVEDWATIGLALAAFVYVVLKLDFGGRAERQARDRRGRRTT